MYVITAHKLDMEQKFSFIYTFKHEKRIVDVKVVRIKEMGGGYGYGCRFIGLSPDTEADIRSFVYMNQIQKRLETVSGSGEAAGGPDDYRGHRFKGREHPHCQGDGGGSLFFFVDR